MPDTATLTTDNVANEAFTIFPTFHLVCSSLRPVQQVTFRENNFHFYLVSIIIVIVNNLTKRSLNNIMGTNLPIDEPSATGPFDLA